ncbi:MAG: sensor signal transduction histidine [Beijerinckiaceae bacterium]|nr:MAG: sensor signal transduction histidine [Beijerinckiaceae bacterium]
MTNTPFPDPDPVAPASARRWPRIGLSARLLILTGLFVLLAEVLIYVPSVANFRSTWLSERISQARAAALILEKTSPDALPKALVDELLLGMETTMIALRIDNTRRLLAISDMPPMIDLEIDLRQSDVMPQIMGAFNSLFFGGDRTIRVIGPPPRGGDFVEIVINEKPLRDAMVRYSWNILQVSLVISGITALLVFAALNGLIVRPVKRLAAAVSRFRNDPADARSIYRPGMRDDELGTLERNVSEMQHTLQQELRQREHLAQLGLAVAKINHDLRNMLASAQLLADRLGSLPDPNVQRFVPKLLDALDRAISFCQSTLAYGKAQERPSELVPVLVKGLVIDVAEQLMLSPASRPALEIDIPDRLSVQADTEHLTRVLTNLVRNARSVLEAASPDRPEPKIRITAAASNGMATIDIADNGPGIPSRIRASLFRAFSGSSRPGGTGLGLAIAQELMRSMGGTITLVDQPEGMGTIFRLTLPAARGH